MPEEITLMPIKAVCARVGLSRTAVYDAMNDDRFPRPVRVGPQTVRWRSDLIARWIDEISGVQAA